MHVHVCQILQNHYIYLTVPFDIQFDNISNFHNINFLLSLSKNVKSKYCVCVSVCKGGEVVTGLFRATCWRIFNFTC